MPSINDEGYQLRPIGRVESLLVDPSAAPAQGDEGAPEACLVLDPALRAMRGLSPGDVVIVLTWLDRADRDVLGHVIGGVQVISSVETGKAPQRGDPATNAGEDPGGAFRKERDLALGAMTEDNLAKKVQSPMGEMPLDQMMGMFLTPDVLIHTWDLAKAAGVEVKLDPQLVDETYNALQPIDARVRPPGVLGPKAKRHAGA